MIIKYVTGSYDDMNKIVLINHTVSGITLSILSLFFFVIGILILS